MVFRTMEVLDMAIAKIIKNKMDIGQAKDIENAVANVEKYQAFMDYIAVCDHPEILEESEVADNE